MSADLQVDYLADGHGGVGVVPVVELQLVEELGEPEPQAVVPELGPVVSRGNN